MSGFEIGVLVLLVAVAALGVVTLLTVRGGGEAAALRARVDELKAALDAIRGDAGTHARAARDELGQGMDRLGATLAGASGERLEAIGKSISNGRIESENHANALRTQLVGQFDTLAKSVGDRMGALGQTSAETLGRHREAASAEATRLRDGVTATLTVLGKRLDDALEGAAKRQVEATGALAGTVKAMADANEKRGEGLRLTVEGRLDHLRTENAAKLDEMRVTVDEKLQGTLNERLGASFSMVNENLERVHKSVGEMQSIATGVGDLKRVLSNVKARGTWGETSLGMLLEQVMTPEQYGTNVEVKPGSGCRVEFAIKMPGGGDQPLWLPIDSKLPTEDYERLMDASERGDAAGVEEAARGLERAIRKCGQDIGTKYVAPPHSTDFGMMFLPTEGLFAEVIRRPGLVDALRREARVVVAGPTTLMANLMALQSGFRTLAIQQRSSEVWQVLGAVKGEFGKFGEVLDKVGKKLGEATKVVEEAGVRRRAVDRRLRDVEALPEAGPVAVLGLAGDGGVEELEAAE